MTTPKFEQTGLRDTPIIRKAFNLLVKYQKENEDKYDTALIASNVAKVQSRLSENGIAFTLASPLFSETTQYRGNFIPFPEASELAAKFNKDIRNMASLMTMIDGELIKHYSTDMQAAFFVTLMSQLWAITKEKENEYGPKSLGNLQNSLRDCLQQNFPEFLPDVENLYIEANKTMRRLREQSDRQKAIEKAEKDATPPPAPAP